MTEHETPAATPDPARTPTPNEFESFYASTPPWDIGRPQPAFQRLADAGQLRGHVLDAGCGTGEHALMAAGLGLETVGVDAAPTPIAMAKTKADERGLSVQFVVGDALDLPALGASFDTVLDCGLFHIFDDRDRDRYVDSLKAVMRSGARYYMLCFSDRQPGDWGPRRVRAEEVRTSFADGWHVDSIEPATLEITIEPERVEAWLAAITRV